jgi:hypothetical protein
MEHEQESLQLESLYDCIHVSSWDEGKVWMNLSLERASARVIMTRAEAERLVEMLQKAMAA